jgi:outer membrane protein OmpA-like peptidoglycan-associated protein
MVPKAAPPPPLPPPKPPAPPPRVTPLPPPPPKAAPPAVVPPGPPPALKVVPPKGPGLPKPEGALPPGPRPPVVQPGGAPPPAVKAPVPPGAPPAARVAPATPGPIVGPRLLDEVKKDRKERVEAGGRRVIQEPGNRLILKQDNRAVIRHDEAERFGRRPGARAERRPDGNVATSYTRPDGTRVVTEVDAHGRLVRRYRRGADGREHNIIDNRRFLRRLAVGVGIGAVAIAILNLPPPRVMIPREKYIVDYDSASDDDLYEALEAPPVEELERAYSLDEIRDNYELRQRMRHVELGNIIFEFGAWEVTPDQYPKLERLARVMLRILSRNPDEVFFIGGHTDAVGSDVDNLSLSDRRAAAVADVLSETFGVPPENLVTQGYGEQYLKINTPGPEPLNRRVDVLRITPLMAER